MEVDSEPVHQDNNDTAGAMVTALCWVSRGHAKPILEYQEMGEDELNRQNKMSKKIKRKA